MKVEERWMDGKMEEKLTVYYNIFYYTIYYRFEMPA